MKRKNDLWLIVAAALLLGVFTAPIFKSGGKQDLTLFEFIKNHTIWYDKELLYVPREDYMAELAPDYMSEMRN